MNQAAPLAPTRHKVDVAAFYRMAEVGIIGSQERLELIDGELIDMPPIGDDHAYSVDVLNERLVLASHGGDRPRMLSSSSKWASLRCNTTTP